MKGGKGGDGRLKGPGARQLQPGLSCTLQLDTCEEIRSGVHQQGEEKEGALVRKGRRRLSPGTAKKQMQQPRPVCGLVGSELRIQL